MTNARQREYGIIVLGVILLMLVVFRQVLMPGQILFTTDDNIGSLMLRKNLLPAGWWRGWNDQVLLGTPSTVFLNLTNFLLFLLPAGFFNNWINAFDIAAGSVFMALFLRFRGVSWPACALGVLTAYWLGSNFTLVYAGHIHKFGILLWVPAFLWLTELAVRKGTLRYAILAGGALGATFLEQADVAFIFALALGPYALFSWWRVHGRPGTQMARFAGGLFGTAILLAFHPLLSGYTTAVEGVASIRDDDPQAKWEFVTQWSWPPEESIDFIAPGFTGWRSGEPAGPYTGRMGRSAGWEDTGEGFQNFKLENQYLGAVPLLFAVLAVYLAFRARRRGQSGYADVWCWAAITVVALLLSFGKYFPLYALFYQLPIVSSIRNPNKFLQVFQLALGILAAYGMHDFLRQSFSEGRDRLRVKDIKPLVFGALLIGLVLVVWGVGSMASWDSLVTQIREDGWGRLAPTIIENRVWALLHGGVMACLAILIVYLLTVRRVPGGRSATVMVWSLIGLVIFDVLFLARHYVSTIETGAMRSHQVTDIIKRDQSGSRVALVMQEGFYNQWLSQLFPYHGIKSINITQMPRMPIDYQQYLTAVGQNPLRHWELGAVRFVLGPGQIWSQISSEPGLRDRFDLIFAYNVEPENGGVEVIPASETQPGRHVLLRHRAPHPRYALVAGWDEVPDDVALNRLTAPDFVPFERVLISGTPPDVNLPEPEGQGLSGSVRRMDYRPGYVQLQVSAESPSILRVADKYDPHWKAEINGVPAPVMRVDYLVQGVFVAAGMHDITLRYAPPNTTLWVQVGGLCIALGALVLVGRERFSRSVTTAER